MFAVVAAGLCTLGAVTGEETPAVEPTPVVQESPVVFEEATSVLGECLADEVTLAGYASKCKVDEPAVKVTPYGSLWSSMSYQTQRTNPGHFTLYVLPEAQQGEDAFHIDVSRSRFGLNIAGPDLACDMKSGGKVEIDFIGEYIDTNRSNARLRHAYWEAGNDDHRFLIGQTWDVVSPLNPHTLNFSVGWYGGNIGFRRAQFRYEKYGEFSPDLKWTLQASLNEDISPNIPNATGLVRESSNYPVIEGRAAFSLMPECGGLPITIGFSGHYGETGADFTTTGPPPLNLPPMDDARFETWSYNVDLSVPLTERAHFQAEFFQGSNLAVFLGGIGQGVCPCNRNAVGSMGGWADLQYTWCDWMTTAVGFGIDDPDNEDFLVGRTLNEFIFANLVFSLTDQLKTGWEVTYWRTFYGDSRLPPDRTGPISTDESVVVEWMVRYNF